MLKLLIVDDSPFMRIAIRKMVEEEKSIKVVGEAKNGVEAVEMAAKFKPDLITMDVEMPEMDGLKATARIMEESPCPILMVSSYTQSGSQTTFKALELGAVDFISKVSSFSDLDISKIKKELLEKANYWGTHPLPEKNKRSNAISMTQSGTIVIAKPLVGKLDIVVIGASTGGPVAVPELLKICGKLKCPVVIAQHMPASYTKGFAEYLGRQSRLNTFEGVHGMKLEQGMVVIAPGGLNATMIRDENKGLVFQTHDKPVTNIKPSADLLFMSAVAVCRNPAAVVLTGMGDDGVKGAAQFRKRDYPVLVQDPDSCVVDGMPNAVIKAGAASEVLTVKEIGRRLALWAG